MGLKQHLLALMKWSKKKLIELLAVQEQEIQALKAQVGELKSHIQELEGKLSKKSHNSHKPPSSDGYAKPNPQSQRTKSNRKPGGQPGHPGVTLKQVNANEVDRTEVHGVSHCAQCGYNLDEAKLVSYEVRQEFEIPVLKRQVIAHRVEARCCTHCGLINRGQFPEHITQPVQYGKRLKAVVTYLNQYQLIPYARLQELLKDVFSVALSQGTLVTINKSYYQQLEALSQQIKETITQSGYAHFDETGLRLCKQLNWLHVASTRRLTHYALHPKRGCAAIEAMGILPQFEGCATHDHFKSYFKYAGSHSLCNAHHLRELVYLKETYGLAWCDAMIQCLLRIKAAVDRRKSLGFKGLTKPALSLWEQAYLEGVIQGLKEMQSIPGLLTTNGLKRHPAKNLLNRLILNRKETLRFMYDFNVCFDNNLAERDLRMIKVKQKVSGCFRSAHGGETFCRIKGYISTVKKHALPVLDALINVFPDTTSLAIASPLSIPPP